MQPRTWVVCFEYRTDGDTSQALSAVHPLAPAITDRYPSFCLNGTANTRTQTFNAIRYVEIRSSFGAEQDDFFDWTRFEVIPNDPGDATLAEIMPFVFTNAEFFGAGLEIFRVGPGGARTSVWRGNVSEHGDVSYILPAATYLANDAYGTYSTNDPQRPTIGVAARYVASVNGHDVQDVVIAPCGYCAPQSYILGADGVNQRQRTSSIWYWVTQ